MTIDAISKKQAAAPSKKQAAAPSKKQAAAPSKKQAAAPGKKQAASINKQQAAAPGRFAPRVFCGELNKPGLAVDYSPYVDFSRRRTTSDQSRIEAVLAQLPLAGRRILHIGIGNSGLARRFAARGALVDGVTVSEAEYGHGRSLELEGYRVHLCNKFSRGFTATFAPGRFDFIVDNNLASFACCQYHLFSMFENYLCCLKPGGMILTDQRGMDWALLDPSLILDFSALARLVDKLPLNAIKVTQMVYALELYSGGERGGASPVDKEKLCVHALRRDRQTPYIETFEPECER